MFKGLIFFVVVFFSGTQQKSMLFFSLQAVFVFKVLFICGTFIANRILKDQELMMLNTSCCFNVPSYTYKNGIWKLMRFILSLSFQPKKRPVPNIFFFGWRNPILISYLFPPPRKKTPNKTNISHTPPQKKKKIKNKK